MRPLEKNAGHVSAARQFFTSEPRILIKLIDQACGLRKPADGPTIGEMVLAVAVRRACAPAAKCHWAAFLELSVPQVSCLPAAAFTGQVTEEQLENVQIEIARAARFLRLPTALFRDEGGGRTQTAQSTLDQDLHGSEIGRAAHFCVTRRVALPDLKPMAATCS
jgi:hypothetical protein